MDQPRVLLVTDLDKTLLDGSAQVPRPCLDAIAAFVAEGGLFTVATGRPTRGALMYPRLMELVGAPIISYNGACIYDAMARRDVLRLTLPDGMPAVLREALDRFPGVGALVFRGQDDVTNTVRENPYTVEVSWKREHYRALPRPLEDLSGPWTKLVVAGAPDEMPPCRDFFLERCPEARIVLSEGVFLEITAGGTGKHTALQVLTELLDIPRERVIAVGDSLNDLDMLRWAGTGVAVDNAEEAVKAEIRSRVASNADCGVRQCVERFALPMLRAQRR